MEILNKQNVNRIVELLNSNAVVALPSDTIYGFSCLATSNEAVNKLVKLKQRELGKQFILLVGKNFELNKLLSLTPYQQTIIQNNTPNAVTFIANTNKQIKLADTFTLSTLAIRIPDDDFLQSILNEVGFMVSTSCNISGQENLNTTTEIKNTFKNLDAVVEYTYNTINPPSTLIDLTNELNVIRQGDYKIKL